MALIIVNGIHTDGGVVRDFGLDIKAQGIDVRLYSYPKRSFIGQWFGTHKKDGAALASFMNDGDDIVCHSNGALVWHESMKSGARWNRCFVFGGAATSDGYDYPVHAFNKAYIIYNPKDWALRIGSWLPFHPFGKLGYAGYRGRKRRDIQNVAGYSKGQGMNHSHYFTTASSAWAEFVIENL